MIIFVIILVSKKVLVYFHQHLSGNAFTEKNQCTCIIVENAEKVSKLKKKSFHMDLD